MPDVSINQQLLSMNTFYDITHYYRILGRCVMANYVPHDIISKFPTDYIGGFTQYIDYSEYFNSKGSFLRRKTLGMPLTVGKYITNNMYAEYPEIILKNDSETEENDKNTFDNDLKLLKEILDKNHFPIKEKNLFETQLHIGDRIIKPYVQNNNVKLDYITGDRFYATRIDNNTVISGVLATHKQVNEKHKTIHYTRLEWHYSTDDERLEDVGLRNSESFRKTKIELYKGESVGSLRHRITGNKLFSMLWLLFGEQIDKEVQEFPELKGDEPTFVLIKNPQQNNKDLHDGRGIGFAVNYLDQFKSIDEAFDSKSTDNVYGAMKIVVPETASEKIRDDKGVTHNHYDPSRPEIFMYNDDEIQGSVPEASAPQLRTEQFIASMNTDIDSVSVAMGISAGALRFDGKSIVTATQVISEKSDTARTIKEYEEVNSDGWKRLFMLIKILNNSIPSAQKLTYEKENIEIEWKDNIIVDDEAEKQFDKELVQEGMMPQTEFLMQHKGLTLKEATEWLVRSMQERAMLNDLTSDDDFDDNPTPREGESKDDFMKRCIPEVVAEGNDEDEARSLCLAKFGE
jgi:A118 family predicted phage portal protein